MIELAQESSQPQVVLELLNARENLYDLPLDGEDDVVLCPDLIARCRVSRDLFRHLVDERVGLRCDDKLLVLEHLRLLVRRHEVQRAVKDLDHHHADITQLSLRLVEAQLDHQLKDL